MKDYPFHYPAFLPEDHWYYDTRDYLEQKLAFREARLNRLIKMTEFKVEDDLVPEPESLDALLAEPNKILKKKQAENAEARLLQWVIEKEYELIAKAKAEIEEWDRIHEN